MGLLDNLSRAFNNLVMLDQLLLSDSERERYTSLDRNYRYYQGDQDRQIKWRAGQADDNIIINVTSLVVERSISLLLGEGVEFDLGENRDGEQAYLDAVWEANRRDILLHRLAQYGAVFGTVYVKIIPAGIESRQVENQMVPRLIAIDPRMIKIDVNEEDHEVVEKYTITFKIHDKATGKERGRKEETIRQYNEPADGIFETAGWMITNYITNERGNWEQMGKPVFWEYEFPPILHWQNLPEIGDVYGQSDIGDIAPIQDRLNFVASNISKIIRYHAHPKTWARAAGSQSRQNWGADEMVVFESGDAMVQNLEMQSELSSSRQYMMDLRQMMFDISRTVDITSISDRVGALTNFGLRVLYMDALAKLNTKRELYGEALVELNHRILVVSAASTTDGGNTIWPEVLPTSEEEETKGLEFDLKYNLTSKQTASEKRGYDWEDEQSRISGEKSNEDNVGAAILRAFNSGREQ